MEQDQKSELHEKYGQSPEQADRANKEGYRSLEEQAEEIRKARGQNTDSDKQEQQIENEFEAEADVHPAGGEHSKQPPVRGSAPKIEV
jgi:hypothetical protein